MTTPVIPAGEITQLPGVGDRIGAAIAPFLEMLKERREREQRQQQLMTQFGMLKVQEEELALEKAKQTATAKGLKETGQAIIEQMRASGQDLGPTEQRIQGLMQTDPQTFMSGLEQINKEQVSAQLKVIGQKYQKLYEGGVAPTLQTQLKMVNEMISVDPQNQGLQNRAVTLEAAIGRSQTKTTRTKVESIERGGRTMRVLINMDTGAEIAEVGDAPETYVDFLAKYGRNSQEASARAAVRFGNAIGKIEKLAEDQSTVDETTEALTLIEGAQRFPWQLGDLAGFTTRLYQQGKIGAGAQIMLRNFYDVLAAEGFGEGGKQLTKAEWDIATRAFMPLMSEAPEAFTEKMQAASTRFKTHWKQGGPASERLLDLLDPTMRARIGKGGAGAGAAPGSGSTEDKLRRTRGLGR